MARTTNEGCSLCYKPKPKLAITHNDPYCSRECAARAYGLRQRQVLARSPNVELSPLVTLAKRLKSEQSA